jgi:hypothetical protein
LKKELFYALLSGKKLKMKSPRWNFL